MYALHPGSIPPHSPKATERTEVSAEDLMALYGVKPFECIVWDPKDKYDWNDFIHLYPSYYGNYTLLEDGRPPKDVPLPEPELNAPSATRRRQPRSK